MHSEEFVVIKVLGYMCASYCISAFIGELVKYLAIRSKNIVGVILIRRSSSYIASWKGKMEVNGVKFNLARVYSTKLPN